MLNIGGDIMAIYSDDKVNKDGSPRKLGGTAAVSKKVSYAGTVENYENSLRTEGKIELLEHLHGRIDQLHVKLDKIEDFMQGKEAIVKEQPRHTLRRIK